ncbi:tetratricopeptide repeat protein [Nocardia sp. NPDC050793]|uniref:tetratricopeptide repeat protein n=1 Tax=Nocardia sp. NPDC050793 TaxID=3155159 RepID=UPI00340D517D
MAVRWQVVSILTLWVGVEIVGLAFFWQAWLIWPGSVLTAAGLAGTFVTERGELRRRPKADLWKGITDRQYEVYEVNVRDLGPDHPDTLNSRDILAGVYERAGRLTEAIHHYEQNLTNCDRVLGPAHIGTLLSRDSLAGAYKSEGRIAEAIRLYEQNLTDSERGLGPDHIGTLDFRNTSPAHTKQRDGRPKPSATTSRTSPTPSGSWRPTTLSL